MTPVTAAAAASHLADPAVTPAMIRLWASRGELKQIGTVRFGGRGRPQNLYDMGDVWNAYTAWARRGCRSLTRRAIFEPV